MDSNRKALNVNGSYIRKATVSKNSVIAAINVSQDFAEDQENVQSDPEHHFENDNSQFPLAEKDTEELPDKIVDEQSEIQSPLKRIGKLENEYNRSEMKSNIGGYSAADQNTDIEDKESDEERMEILDKGDEDNELEEHLMDDFKAGGANYQSNMASFVNNYGISIKGLAMYVVDSKFTSDSRMMIQLMKYVAPKDSF